MSSVMNTGPHSMKFEKQPGEIGAHVFEMPKVIASNRTVALLQELREVICPKFKISF